MNRAEEIAAPEAVTAGPEETTSDSATETAAREAEAARAAANAAAANAVETVCL